MMSFFVFMARDVRVVTPSLPSLRVDQRNSSENPHATTVPVGLLLFAIPYSWLVNPEPSPAEFRFSKSHRACLQPAVNSFSFGVGAHRNTTLPRD